MTREQLNTFSGLFVAIAKDFRFIGRLCLDFAQTGDMGWGARYERLTKPSELQRWFSLSSLQLAGIKVTETDLEEAKNLRKAIWKVAEAVLADAAPAAADVRLINRIGCQPNLVKELDGKATSARWHRPVFAAAIATVAADAVSLFGDQLQRSR